MGQRQDQDEIIYGDDCLACFDAGETPEYVYVRFSEIQKCIVGDPDLCKIPPNDQVFKLTQTAVSPCRWEYDQAGWLISFGEYPGASPLGSYLTLLGDGLGYFSSYIDGCAPEGTVFHNQWPPCNGMFCGTGGIGIVTWRLETLLILGLINMVTDDDLFMEMRPVDDGSRVYKFCRLRDATNIAILFEPD